MSELTKTTLYLPEGDYRTLKAMGRRQGRSAAELVREAVGTWLSVASGYPEHVKAEAEWARISAQAGEAALDAATATILEDSLDGYVAEAAEKGRPLSLVMVDLDHFREINERHGHERADGIIKAVVGLFRTLQVPERASKSSASLVLGPVAQGTAAHDDQSDI